MFGRECGGGWASGEAEVWMAFEERVIVSACMVGRSCGSPMSGCEMHVELEVLK